MSYILALALGPVQEFIAAARKARDLWAGSQLLSAISRAAAQAVLDGAPGAELVFPHAHDLARGASVANKIVASLPADADPRALALAARDAAQGVLTAWGVGARMTAQKRAAEAAVNWNLADAQAKTFLEFYAVWHPYADDTDYESARAKADLLLAGRKALRDFGQPGAATEGRPKSALDPARESVLELVPRAHPQYEARSAQLARLQIRPSEQLDGVSLTKRTASLRQFVSVSRVAADPFLRRVRDDPAMNTLQALAATLAKQRDEETAVQRLSRDPHLRHYDYFPFDTQLFYDEEPLTDLDAGETTTAEQFRAAVRDLRERHHLGEISPYLAVLVADGDRMGAAISALADRAKHQELSRALSRFAEQAEAVVAEHFGALVYSGGDDVLAFLPLDTALGCADGLREAFDTALAEADLMLPSRPTLSVGISIGHYGTHLDTLRRWGSDAERLAKSLRNALAVTLHTRSAGGDGLATVASWQEHPVTARWGAWTRAYRGEALPSGIAYKLRSLADEVARATESGHRTDGVLEAEVRRILTKSRSRRGTEEIAEETARAITDQVGGSGEELERVVTELLIARHLAAAEEMAAPAGAPVSAPAEDVP